LLYSRIIVWLAVIQIGCQCKLPAQCLSSVSPVGGTSNLMVQEKNTLHVISFYKFNYGNQYFEKDHHADFDLIKAANYNYVGSILGYGITEKVTLESEFGYFINKTQIYDIEPSYTLRGYGFSNAIVSLKSGLYSNHVRRVYFSASLGAKIPFSTRPKVIDGVELPIELQPTIGAYGMVIQSFFIKENSGKGLRYFITNRVEVNFPNKQDYHQGTAVFTSFFISKHIMSPKIKGDWTLILQVRNEFRARDKRECCFRESTGGTLFYISPQINYSIKELWNISTLFEIPCYQYFNGTQLGTCFGITCSVSRMINLVK